MCLFSSLILFVSHLSLVYKQPFSSQQAIHKLFTKKSKAKQGGHIFASYLIFFCMASAGRPSAADRQAGGQVGSPLALPSPASWVVAAGQLHCSMSSENLDMSVHPSACQHCQLALHLVVSEFSEGRQGYFCLGLYILSHLWQWKSISWVLQVQRDPAIQNLWIIRNVFQGNGHSVCFAMQEISLDITKF